MENISTQQTSFLGMKVHGDGAFPTKTPWQMMMMMNDDRLLFKTFALACMFISRWRRRGGGGVYSVVWCILLLYPVAIRCALHQYKYKYKYMDFLFFFRVSHEEEITFFVVNEFCRTIWWFMNFLHLKNKLILKILEASSLLNDKNPIFYACLEEVIQFNLYEWKT